MMDRSRYPAEWEAISEYIRFERAGGRCEWCNAVNNAPHPKTGSTVVLTVAHLNHDPENTPSLEEIKAGDPRGERLKSLCQRCHLRYDRDRHIRRRMLSYAEKIGQPWLLTDGLETEGQKQ